MRSWPRWKNRWAVQFLLLALFLSHIPFLASDPDSLISFSRGPFTDEGLNTIQVRNFINHGQLDVAECDNLLKTPLFGLTVGTTMLIFGAHLYVSRLTVLVLVMAVLLFLSLKKPFTPLIALALPVLFLKYQVFQFSHFSLAEMASVAFILLGVYFIHRTYIPFHSEKENITNALLAGTFLSLAWFLKIQFIYILFLGPIIAIDRAILYRKLSRKRLWLNGMVLTSTTLLFLIIYMLAWYLPFKETYDHMMAHQSGTIAIGPKTIEYIRFNLTYFLFSDGNKWFSISFILSLAAGSILLFKKTSGHFPTLFKTNLVWLVLELHKLTMVYLPTRYQISLYAAMGITMAVVWVELLTTEQPLLGPGWKTAIKSAVMLLIAILFVGHLTDYQRTLRSRTYQLRMANEYLARTLEKDDVVLGAWAPSLTWVSGCIAKPVWGGFLNDAQPLERFHPALVVSEPDQQDSEQAYQNQGIDLEMASDSVKNFQIGSWQVNLYWIKKSQP